MQKAKKIQEEKLNKDIDDKTKASQVKAGEENDNLDDSEEIKTEIELSSEQ